MNECFQMRKRLDAVVETNLNPKFEYFQRLEPWENISSLWIVKNDRREKYLVSDIMLPSIVS